MASDWELGMGFGFGMGSHAPNYAVTANSPAYLYGLPTADNLRIDDLLDLSNQEIFSSSAAAIADCRSSHILPKQEESSSVNRSQPVVGESGSSSNCNVSSFPDDLYMPCEEAAELEWLSKFVEDSFSDVPYPSNYLPTTNTQIRVDHTSIIPGRGARSKRSRAASTNLTAIAPSAPNQSTSSSSTSSSSSSDFPPTAHVSGGSNTAGSFGESMNGARRCTHCASEKTPQWRTGPLGPKTLCNACGVRYKSGRLVPEYRPAASPTFVLTQHSNSHRKVMELRRQKEELHLYHAS